MAADKHWIMSRVPPGPGRALDLGGGRGELQPLLRERGFAYTNLDLEPSGPGAVAGDAHQMPFEAGSFDLVVSNDSLEQLHDPLIALQEVQRVLRPGGRLVLWVPFMHPFYGEDYFRFTPLGLDHLVTKVGLRRESLESPLGPMTVLATMLGVLLHRAGARRATGVVRRTGQWLDVRLRAWLPDGGYAAAYLLVAVKPAAA